MALEVRKIVPVPLESPPAPPSQRISPKNVTVNFVLENIPW